MDVPIDDPKHSDEDSVRPKPLTIREENYHLISTLRSEILAGRARFCLVKAEVCHAENARLEKEENERRLVEQKQLQKVQEEEDAKIADTIACAKSQFFEIRTRSDRLLKKCNVDFTSLSDFEILDIKKREEIFHTELREFLDKVSAFETLIVPCGSLAHGMRDEVISMRQNCSLKVDFFIDELSNTVKARDISERKLKNSPGLKIELKKFKGYESEVDIFAFRSSFKKLVEPEVQASLLADILKKNYLDGPAYNLVSKIESISEIWEKLFEVYGNCLLLLQK